MARIVKYFSIVSAILIGLLVVGILIKTAPYRELNAWNRDVTARLETARSIPPQGVGQLQWETIVRWTQIAFPNVFFTPDYIVDETSFVMFKRQLADRLNKDIDVETIAWIWDQLAIQGKNGAEYSRKYRSVAPFGECQLDVNGKPFDNVRIADNLVSKLVIEADEQTDGHETADRPR